MSKPDWSTIRATRTKTERVVAEKLRQLYPDLAFEQNQRIAGYLPDFYFPKQRMLLEVDGGVHDDHDGVHRDARKDERLKAAGYSVFRMRNADIWADPENAAHVIAATLGILHPDLDPERVWDRYTRRSHKAYKGPSDFGPRTARARRKTW